MSQINEAVRQAVGPELSAMLDDPEVIEVMVNPDGSVWVDQRGLGPRATETALPVDQIAEIIHRIATLVGVQPDAGRPLLSCHLPISEPPGLHLHFVGVLPPVLRTGAFAIRKPLRDVITLARHVETGILTEGQTAFLRQAARDHRTILVAGRPRSGKTLLLNALLNDLAGNGEHVIVLEERPEIILDCDDHVGFYAEAGSATMSDLLPRAMQLNPDRLVIGEINGPEITAMLEAWQHLRGGMATVIAGSVKEVLARLEVMAGAASPADAARYRALIAAAIQIIVFLGGRGPHRRVREIVRVVKSEAEGYRLEPMSR